MRTLYNLWPSFFTLDPNFEVPGPSVTNTRHALLYKDLLRSSSRSLALPCALPRQRTDTVHCPVEGAPYKILSKDLIRSLIRTL